MPMFWPIVWPAISTPEMIVRANVPSSAPLKASALTAISMPQAPGTVAGILLTAPLTQTAMARPARMRMRVGTAGSPKPGNSRKAALTRTNTSSIR